MMLQIIIVPQISQNTYFGSFHSDELNSQNRCLITGESLWPDCFVCLMFYYIQYPNTCIVFYLSITVFNTYNVDNQQTICTKEKRG